jgi:hypothetical protein
MNDMADNSNRYNNRTPAHKYLAAIFSYTASTRVFAVAAEPDLT